MTTMHAAAARRSHPSVALAVLTMLASTGLAGCETSSSLFGGGSSFFGGSLFGGSSNTPAPETAAIPPPAPQAPLAKVAISPIIGAPDAIGKQIQQEFTSSVQSKRVSVVAGKEERADYTLRGYVVAAKDKSATKVSYIWDVTDPSGKRVNRITGEEVLSGGNAKDPWSSLTPQVAQAIAGKAASSFVSWLPSQGGQGGPVASAGPPSTVGAQPAAARPPEATRTASLPQPVAAAQPAPPAAGNLGGGSVTAVVPRVTGAPGDGSSSLTAAIQRELSSKGVSVTDKATSVAYRVEGSVSVGAAKDGKQPINIEWLVKDPKGKKLGTVSQKNEIPEGSLNGAWDQTADQAASAAAQGIVKLLPGAKAGG